MCGLLCVVWVVVVCDVCLCVSLLVAVYQKAGLEKTALFFVCVFVAFLFVACEWFVVCVVFVCFKALFFVFVSVC